MRRTVARTRVPAAAIVVSSILLVFGIVFDVGVVTPHTTVSITLINGRQEIITVQWVGDYPTDRKSLARELSDRGVAVQASDIGEVRVLRGLKYWWWSDYVGTMSAAVFIGLLWLAFYVVRWIARGFARP